MEGQGFLGFSGKLKAKKIPRPKAPLLWRLRNWLRWHFLWNWFTFHGAKFFSKVTGIVTMTGSLKILHISKDGVVTDYGTVARGLVTTAFVNFLVDQLQTETSVFGDFKYHDSGVGVTGASNGDTDIETTDGESRATGSQEEGASANIYKSIGTIAYTTSKAITEHGLFNAASGVTLMDRHTFTAINVVNGDSIEFTYELTANAET